jgi:hypothetical protein
VDAWVGLDPVDMNGTDKIAAAKVPPRRPHPRRATGLEHARNANALADAIPGEKCLLRIPGATHLDAKWPTDLLGQLACGFVDEKRQQQVREKATEFLKKTLLK